MPLGERIEMPRRGNFCALVRCGFPVCKTSLYAALEIRTALKASRSEPRVLSFPIELAKLF
jgi:hypothetical protein